QGISMRDADTTPGSVTTARPSTAGHGHSHLGWALVLISVAQLMVVLDATIANIALPFIREDLNISQANLQWIVTGYSLAFGGLLLLGGRLGDLYGRRRNRAFSVYAARSGVGAAVGLILGGWLTGLHPDILGISVDGWRLTFLINVPIGLAAAALAPRVLGESESNPGELDVPGALTATLGLVAIVFGLSRAGQQ